MDQKLLKKKMTVYIEVPYLEIWSLLVSALENGHNEYVNAVVTPLQETSTRRSPSDRFYENILTYGFDIKLPRCKVRRVRFSVYAVALKTMASKYPHAFAAIFNGRADASTGEIFMDLLLDGKLRWKI